MDMDERIQGRKISCPDFNGNFTYILCCSDGSLYTGWTTNLKRRLKAHNDGTGSKYTRTRRPVKLVYYEQSADRREAMSREWHIKRMDRDEKLRLILSAAGVDTPSEISISMQEIGS